MDGIVARLVRTSFATLAFSTVCPLGAAPTAADESTSDVLGQGKYLMTGAGQCTDCHGAKLTGGRNPIPGPPGAPWAKTVPSLRGLPMFKTDADATHFLMTAVLANGKHARPPMPHFKFKRADASAIVAYLRTLK